MIEFTCFVKKVVLFTFSPFFTVHRSLRNLTYARTCLIMSVRGILTFTYLSTSKFSVRLFTLFLPLSAWGNGGGMLFFIMFSLITIYFGSSPWSSFTSSSGSSIGCSTFLPLFKVITAFTATSHLVDSFGILLGL